MPRSAQPFLDSRRTQNELTRPISLSALCYSVIADPPMRPGGAGREKDRKPNTSDTPRQWTKKLG